MSSIELDLYRQIPTEFEKWNPYISDPILSALGKVPKQIKKEQMYIDFGVLEGEAGRSTWSDQRIFAGNNGAIPKTFPVKVKYLTQRLQLNSEQYENYKANDPTAIALYNERAELAASQLKQDMLGLSIGFNDATYLNQPNSTTFDYDEEWTPLFHARAADGESYKDPADMNPTSGDIQDLTAYNLSGTNKTQDLINKTFGAISKRFFQLKDSWGRRVVDLESLYGRPAVTHIVNASFYDDLASLHPKSGSNELDITYLEALNKLNHKVIPSDYITSTYANTEDGEVTILSCADMEKNFKIGIASPFNQIPLKLFENPNTLEEAYSFFETRWGLYKKPYKIGTHYYKAMQFWKIKFQNDA